jgi:hypothetical protein
MLTGFGRHFPLLVPKAGRKYSDTLVAGKEVIASRRVGGRLNEPGREKTSIFRKGE